MTSEVLSVNNVRKSIKKKAIIKGISFKINEGEVLGFLGPNGAGKSTTLRMIVGLSRPSAGSITICGHSITKNYVEAMSNVGCIIEGPDLYNYMTGIGNLEMLGAMSKNVSDKDIREAIELVGMENRINDKVSTYSMGMKQRLGLAQALIHRPKLLVLDEPTNGLDPQGIYEFRSIIKDLATEKNISVLISSHLISEVQLMCDNVSIINQGLIIKNANVKELLSSGDVFWVVDDLVKAQKILKKQFEIESSIVNNHENLQLEASIDLNNLETINQVFIQQGLKLKYSSTMNKTLEELFLSLTENEKII